MKSTTRLRLVDNNDQTKPPKRWQGKDQVFFHKSQIKPGTRVVCFGRVNHGDEWIVDEIKTYRITKSGRAIPSQVNEVTKLTDDIVLRRVGGNVFRQVSFASLSYSAVWRLA